MNKKQIKSIERELLRKWEAGNRLVMKNTDLTRWVQLNKNWLDQALHLAQQYEETAADAEPTPNRKIELTRAAKKYARLRSQLLRV